MVTVTENLFIDTTINSTNKFLVNSEAHTSRRLLHRRSADEDEPGEEEDEVPAIENEKNDDDHEEEKPDEDVEETEEENDDDNLVLELNIDQLIHSKSPSKFSSFPSCPFTGGWGRGSRPISISPQSPPCPTLGYENVNAFDQHKSETSISKHINGNDQQQVTKNITITPAINEYYYHDYIPKRPFNHVIDFSFNVSTTKIIFDNENGFTKATHALQKNAIQHEVTRNYSDIWPFCLNSRTIRFFHLPELESQKLNNDNLKQLIIPLTRISPSDLLTYDSQYWFAFERRPTFNEEKFNIDIESIKTQSESMTNNTILGRIKFFRGVHVKLSYGALTSMNEYYYHPEYCFTKRTEWTVQFRPKRLEIERSEEKRVGDNNDCKKIFRRSILPADLIDRAAIFTVDRLGFSVYICVKGNPHEYTRIASSAENRYQIDRIPSTNKDCPIFSTICLHVLVKTNRSNNHLTDHDKYSSLEQVKLLFKYLVDFFYSNQISVCFASIKSDRGCLTNIPALSKLFKTPIQIYAFTMLKNVGYSIEQKIYQQKIFCQSLLQISDNDDDKFYRLCLYLFRRASEYHFLNLENELHDALREYANQLEQCVAINEKMATILSPPRENYAYVPSIRVTPTTIQVQPLKLVKLHRVIREKKFDDPMSYALVEIRDEANKALYARDFRSLRKTFKQILTDGIQTNKIHYRYLHHSMSQVKEKQFWFLNTRYSLEDVLSWMGNFDNERVVAKHAARIAQCFTSTEPSIRILAEHVKYIPDIETPDKQYCFTDGVGTLSPRFCKMVQKELGRRFMPSVLQIRYGGCKGTVSVDPRLENQPQQLVIRESMRKFTSDHDQLEICKVSSPRALYLNRQAILLLSSRGIPDSHFLVLQNENHLWLVQSLLSSSIAFELLNDRVGSAYFNFRDIAKDINLVEEPFFLQLIVTSGHDCVSKFQQRAKIKTDKNKARNMFGIVDEFGVLEYGQVFIQYNHINDEKLDMTDKPSNVPPTILDNTKVVITKNPCYHPGDLRTFIAVDRKELRHLVDVVVFPQKGHRPHPNEISGSDLDGDEYAVIWDSDLVPLTTNDEPYNYDSQEKPIKCDHPVERDDINEIVLDIAAQNLTGDMSNLHLALADSLGTRDIEVLGLAGFISQELDAPKTGKHPITSEELYYYRVNLLKERYPDFMMKERYKSYPSEKIIGQLYRSARRAIIRWHKAARTHCSLRHLKTVQLHDESIDDENLDTPNSNSSIASHNSSQWLRPKYDNMRTNHELSLTLDPDLNHPLSECHIRWARNLFSMYRANLRNIISVFNYQDEIDLFCRCEALDQLASGKQDINISAGLELQRLIGLTRRLFYHQFTQSTTDSTSKPPHDGPCTRPNSCSECEEIKLARAAACYHVCYSQAATLSTKARSRILSFPWLFGTLLTELKRRQQNQNSNSNINYVSKHVVIGRAMRNAAKRLLENKALKLKIFWPAFSDKAHLFLRSINSTSKNNSKLFKRDIIERDQQTDSMSLSKILFIEIMNEWIRRQNIFGEILIRTDKKPLIRDICWHQLLINFILNSNEDVLNDSYKSSNFEQYKVVFQSSNNFLMTQRYFEHIKCEVSASSINFDNSMYDHCICLIRLCFRLARNQKSNEYAILSDYLIHALQSIGIEKELNDMSIDIDT
ncbi:unnamed protein product [Rotaria magnacalcarata]|uniref:RNA-directed RNA polymerase n=7 Tax=Rotaria magnacalcarata TaxID=392030 RepID=A0A819ICH6_9BILA|nr:unnamed protein product [Rotaria magnacalcarata]CAF1967765.1 unnamed protein product [Rotaria magnacalcarata]CAF3806894.1 unnamed protein product [Rotaria magnacalcarata]CAF3909895.1 unnamed protein product [Rotaria magnacalcarata]